MSLSNKQTRWCCEALFFLFAFGFLGVYNADYLYKLQSQDLFLANRVFAGETLPQTAGLLVYVAKFLNQLLFIPLLGGALMAAGLVGIERMVARLSKCETNLQLLCAFVPSLLVLVTQTSAGYAVYDNFDCSFAVSLELGLLIALALANANMALTTKYGIKGMAISAVWAVIFYFVIGNFSSFALLLAGLSIRRTDKKVSVSVLASGVVLFLLLPFLATSLVQEDYCFTLISPIVQPYFKPIFYCSILALVATLLYVAKPLSAEPKVLEKLLVTPVALLALCAVASYCSFHDANYRTELKMQRCIEHFDFDGVLEASNAVERPTRPIAAYRYVALEMKDQLATDLFNFPVRYDTLQSPYTNLMPLIYYPDLFLYSSELNTSIFWTMEAWTNTNRSVSAIRRLALISILQNEQETAHKYIAQLKQTISNRSWANEFDQYIGHPTKLFAAYPFLQSVYENQLPFEDHYSGTATLPNIMFSYVNLGRTNMERRLLLHLYEKDTKGFMGDLQMVASMYSKQMPTYMQEIVVLYDLNTNLHVANYFKIQPAVIQNVKNFVAQAQPFAQDPESGAEQLKGYKGMYLYYLLFSNPYPTTQTSNNK